jgi:hypothetical protein
MNSNVGDHLLSRMREQFVLKLKVFRRSETAQNSRLLKWKRLLWLAGLRPPQ